MILGLNLDRASHRARYESYFFTKSLQINLLTLEHTTLSSRLATQGTAAVCSRA